MQIDDVKGLSEPTKRPPTQAGGLFALISLDQA
jgi:hypothetical protein